MRRVVCGVVLGIVAVGGCADSDREPELADLSAGSDISDSQPLVPPQDEPVVSASADGVVPDTLAAETAETGHAATFRRLCEAYVASNASEWEKAEAELLSSGTAAVPALSAALTSGALHERELAASLLVQLGPTSAEAKSAIARGLSDESAFVRANCAAALAGAGEVTPELIGALERLLTEDDRDGRLMAATSAANLGSAAAPLLPALRQLTSGDPDDELTRQATRAVEAIGADQQQPAESTPPADTPDEKQPPGLQ